ncbi:enoyl-CoA hydratase [Pseudohalioglobus sediminis]|uniref:Enoyl-CoA hydratase n=1 Tax=Pseudohalioglobus sediminis TaxID=2606449 RepID=A0A5B0X3W4_9GAMM|nr:enoyl-CoA hydratase-related protein [Pseudohalioglobus sediminis]KAA1193237.1 enoyl-CoA hydratase [Pseudohalioglobus sediminis]
MAFTSSTLSLEITSHVATLWLDRPDKLNAICFDMWGDFIRAMDAVAANEDIRAVVIAGRGKSFCVGIDLASLGSAPDLSTTSGCLEQLQHTRLCQDGITAIARCPVPVIAAIHSHCLGAGVDLATACDIRLASEDALFGVRETRIGIVADVGTLQRLPGVVSAGHVAELAYTGKDISAARAEKIGLVNDVYTDADAVYQAALALAGEIAANAPLAVRGTKFVLQQSEGMTTDQSLLLNGLWTMISSLKSNDLKEAMQAFMEKRPPEFSGS